MKAYHDEKPLDELIALCNHDETVELINISTWGNPQKRKALIASIYYEAIENIKGEHAFFLEKRLRENCSNSEEKQEFSVPSYIVNSINYITG